MLNQDQIQALRASFPPEALGRDTSRGFELTSIKAAFVIERLNEVFGPCGIGWRYVHSPFEDLHPNSGRTEVVTEVALQYRFTVTSECVGTGPVRWSSQVQGWAVRTSEMSTAWSEPVFACGGKGLGKGGAAITDARKSAVTDGLTKAASMLGIGHQVFKGLVRVGANGRQRAHGGNGNRGKDARVNGKEQKSGPTKFWSLYHEAGKEADVALETAKALAGEEDWAKAYTELCALIEQGT